MSDFADLMQELLGSLRTEPATETKDRYEPKPTMYGGVMFRSALEASWARTMTINGVKWEYEPELITLPSGTRYLPDFRLPELGAWLEVKGHNIPRIEKARELAKTIACGCEPVMTCTCVLRGGEIVIVGHPPLVTSDPPSYRRRWWLSWTMARGGAGWFVRCPECNTAGWTTSAECRACHAPVAVVRGSGCGGGADRLPAARGRVSPAAALLTPSLAVHRAAVPTRAAFEAVRLSLSARRPNRALSADALRGAPGISPSTRRGNCEPAPESPPRQRDRSRRMPAMVVGCRPRALPGMPRDVLR